ncbi:MAG TPA: fibronectin type III domain-containing protein, partial [Longimicrobiaceae bacterium]|nr:fibronectin type III domain-containing protein [Longimicrobiaceae bacterium]
WLMDGTAWRGRQVVLPTVPREWEIVGLMGISITGPAPTATTGAATSPTGTGLTLNAQVNTSGLPAIAWFEYRKAGDLDFTSTPPRSMDGTSVTVPLEKRVEGLAANLPYTFRVVIANAAAMARGAEQSFTLVPAAPPAVETGDARDLDRDGMTLPGSVDPNGAATEAWFEWGLSPTLASAATSPVQDVGAGNVPVAVSVRIPDTTYYQTYYYRLVARNSQGTSHGAIRSVMYQRPPAPAGVQGVFIRPGYSIQVTWTPAPTVTYYHIFSDTGEKLLGAPPFTDRSFAVDRARRVDMFVQACNALGCGGGTVISTMTEALPAPTEFTAASSEGVRLAWKDNSEGEIFFVIQKRIGSGLWTHLVTTAPNDTTYTDRQVQAGVTYEYRITAAIHGERFWGESSVRNSAAAMATVTHTGP